LRIATGHIQRRNRLPYNNWLKNIAIMGGMLTSRHTAGRYSCAALAALKRERHPPAIIESVLTIGAYQRAVGKPVTIT
jgi:hypothetical protein